MIKHAWSWRLIALAMVLLVPTPAWAAPALAEGPPETGIKPIVVIGVTGYDALHADLDFLGQLVGNPNMAQSVDGVIAMLTQFQGLAGLDKSRPLGGVLANDGVSTNVLAFVPVTNTEKLLSALSKLVGQPEKLEDKLWRLKINRVDAFIKEANGWAFIGQSEESLLHLPPDPLKLLGGLTDEYDLAVRVHAQNVPAEYREMAIDQIKVGMEGGLRQRSDETEAEYERRAAAMRRQMESLVTMIDEIDQLTVGYSVDAKNRHAVFDLSMTSIPNGSLSKAFAEMANLHTQVAGFLMPDATVRALVASHINEDEIPMWTELLGESRNQIVDEIGNDEDLDEQQKEIAKGLVQELHDVLVETIKQGELDGGLVVLGSGPFSGGFGFRVADGKKMEDLFKRAIDLALTAHADEPDLPTVQWDFETYQGMRFHKITTPPIGEDDNDYDDFSKVFGGDRLDLYFGFRQELVLIGVGQKGLETLKTIVDKSVAGPVPAEMPVEINVALGPILRFAAKQDPDDPGLAVLVSAIEGEKNDHLNITVRPIPRGARYRLELEEGVLKLFPAMAQLP